MPIDRIVAGKVSLSIPKMGMTLDSDFGSRTGTPLMPLTDRTSCSPAMAWIWAGGRPPAPSFATITMSASAGARSCW